ncbi:hypothetical protein AX16_007903 [Volvariella volvacea WC 439]|nr:hypothetical protein AX16_007903 [Volvariella volvacea WC 439]
MFWCHRDGAIQGEIDIPLRFKDALDRHRNVFTRVQCTDFTLEPLSQKDTSRAEKRKPNAKDSELSMIRVRVGRIDHKGQWLETLFDEIKEEKMSDAGDK